MIDRRRFFRTAATLLVAAPLAKLSVEESGVIRGHPLRCLEKILDVSPGELLGLVRRGKISIASLDRAGIHLS